MTEEKKENNTIAIWLSVIGLISSVLVACIYNADKLKEYLHKSGETTVFVDCAAYDSRHEYLKKQLELEKNAEKIIFVTDKLTNAYFTEEFFKSDIEPPVLSNKKWKLVTKEVLVAMRERGLNFQNLLQYGSTTIICLVSEEYVKEQMSAGEINIYRLKQFVKDAKKYKTLKVVVVVPREQIIRLVKGAAIIINKGVTNVVVAAQANSVIPDLNFDKEVICGTGNPAISEFINQSSQLIVTYQTRDVNYLENIMTQSLQGVKTDIKKGNFK